jgi:hypothetical protein
VKYVGNKLEADEASDGFTLQWFDGIDDAISAAKNIAPHASENTSLYEAKFMAVRELAILEAYKAQQQSI